MKRHAKECENLHIAVIIFSTSAWEGSSLHSRWHFGQYYFMTRVASEIPLNLCSIIRGKWTSYCYAKWYCKIIKITRITVRSTRPVTWWNRRGNYNCKVISDTTYLTYSGSRNLYILYRPISMLILLWLIHLEVPIIKIECEATESNSSFERETKVHLGVLTYCWLHQLQLPSSSP